MVFTAHQKYSTSSAKWICSLSTDTLPDTSTQVPREQIRFGESWRIVPNVSSTTVNDRLSLQHPSFFSYSISVSSSPFHSLFLQLPTFTKKKTYLTLNVHDIAYTNTLFFSTNTRVNARRVASVFHSWSQMPLFSGRVVARRQCLLPQFRIYFLYFFFAFFVSPFGTLLKCKDNIKCANCIEVRFVRQKRVKLATGSS